MARIRDVAEQIRGVTFAKDEATSEPRDAHVPVMTATNITELGLQAGSILYIPASKSTERQFLKTNDVLITASSGSLSVVGRAVQVKSDTRATFGAFCKVLRPGHLVDPDYFAHYFRTAKYRHRVSMLAAGANINNLKNEDLDELRFPLPPLAEQRRIAAILDHADELRTKRRCALALLDELARSVFIHSLEAARKSNRLVPTRELGSLILSAQNGLYRPSSDYGTGVPILRIADFAAGDILTLKGLARVRIPEVEAARFVLDDGDLVVNRVNAMTHVGKAALVDSVAEPTVFESNMMRVRLDHAQVLPQFVLAWLQTADAMGQVRGSAKQAINQASINQGDLNALHLPLPEMALQHDLVNQLRAIRAARNLHFTTLTKLDELFASLQSRAFAGQL